MNLRFVTFLVFILSAFFFGHLAVYFYFIAIFGISSPVTIKVMNALTVLLPICYIASLIISEWLSSSLLAKIFYRASVYWVSFFLYLFLAAVAFLVYQYFLPAHDAIFWGKVIFVIAMIVSSYGVVHAKNVKVKRLELSLKHLPAAWKGRKLVFLSDVHLGHINGANYALKLTNIINREKADIVLMGGDIFDGARGNQEDLAYPFKNLKSVYGTYAILGNHEEFQDNIPFKDALINQGIKIIEDDMVVVNGLQIVGVDYKTTTWKEGFESVLRKFPLKKSVASILLKHVPTDIPLAAKYNFSLALYGHTHRAQAWPLSLITHYLYKGFDYGLKKYDNMITYTSSGAGTWSPPIRVGSDCEIMVFTLK
jgi:uncharacterized protein